MARDALARCLVLSTLHVNRPEEAAVRLRDLGVEPYIVEAVLRGALGQELVPVAGGRALRWGLWAAGENWKFYRETRGKALGIFWCLSVKRELWAVLDGSDGAREHATYDCFGIRLVDSA